MASAKNISPEVCTVTDADGAVLLDLGKGKYYSLNGVGAVIWQQLCAAKAPPDIVMHLVDVYDVALTDAQKDVAEFIASLEHARLLSANC